MCYAQCPTCACTSTPSQSHSLLTSRRLGPRPLRPHGLLRGLGRQQQRVGRRLVPAWRRREQGRQGGRAGADVQQAAQQRAQRPDGVACAEHKGRVCYGEYCMCAGFTGKVGECRFLRAQDSRGGSETSRRLQQCNQCSLAVCGARSTAEGAEQLECEHVESSPITVSLLASSRVNPCWDGSGSGSVKTSLGLRVSVQHGITSAS